MKAFKIHTEDTASPPADKALGEVKSTLGFIPNVFAVIAESAPALQAFVDLNNHLASSSLSATERELVQITTSVENECRYCVAGHSAFAAMQEVSDEVVEAARSGGPIPDDRLNALHRLTLSLVRRKGSVDPDARTRLEARVLRGCCELRFEVAALEDPQTEVAHVREHSRTCVSAAWPRQGVGSKSPESGH